MLKEKLITKNELDYCKNCGCPIDICCGQKLQEELEKAMLTNGIFKANVEKENKKEAKPWLVFAKTVTKQHPAILVKNVAKQKNKRQNHAEQKI